MRAFESLLDDGLLHADRCVMIQVATPTREAVEHYRDERHEIERLVGEINGRHARLGQPVLHYLYRSLPLDDLVALYLAGDVMLVTPLGDGMNLVAKEYVAARRDVERRPGAVGVRRRRRRADRRRARQPPRRRGAARAIMHRRRDAPRRAHGRACGRCATPSPAATCRAGPSASSTCSRCPTRDAVDDAVRRSRRPGGRRRRPRPPAARRVSTSTACSRRSSATPPTPHSFPGTIDVLVRPVGTTPVGIVSGRTLERPRPLRLPGGGDGRRQPRRRAARAAPRRRSPPRSRAATRPAPRPSPSGRRVRPVPAPGSSRSRRRRAPRARGRPGDARCRRRPRNWRARRCAFAGTDVKRGAACVELGARPASKAAAIADMRAEAGAAAVIVRRRRPHRRGRVRRARRRRPRRARRRGRTAAGAPPARSGGRPPPPAPPRRVAVARAGQDGRIDLGSFATTRA